MDLRPPDDVNELGAEKSKCMTHAPGPGDCLCPLGFLFTMVHSENFLN